MNRTQRLDPGAPGDLTQETFPMNCAEEVLRVTGVEKRYRVGDRSLDVLRGVSLSANRGEYLALRGSSGAGKSTLLHLCGGLDTVDAGTIVVAGETLSSMDGGALARFRNRRIGFVFQAYQLLPELTAWENVALPARIARIAVPIAAKKARALLDRVGLAERLEHRPNQLSGGEQQRVAIARAWVNDPEVLLADEPTGNLDSRTGSEILQLLLELRAEHGTTLVIATHDSRIADQAGRTIELVDGRIATEQG